MRLQIQVPDQGQKAQESSTECLNCHLWPWGLAVQTQLGLIYLETHFPFLPSQEAKLILRLLDSIWDELIYSRRPEDFAQSKSYHECGVTGQG